jgi:hypothetical protein
VAQESGDPYRFSRFENIPIALKIQTYFVVRRAAT